MKKFFASLLAAALVLSLAACGGGTVPAVSGSSSGSSSGDVSQKPAPAAVPFTLAFYPDYSIHPALAANRANLTLASLLYEPLFAVDASFQARPVLCQSYTVSEDKLVWTLTLRSGVTFSDGTPLDGAAVADALELARSGRSRYQARLAGVASADAPAEAPNQVIITLHRPNGSLPLLLDIPIALGEEDRPAGTGPYALAEDGLSLAARSGWWQRDKALPLRSIPLHEVHKSDELIYAFDAGEISLVDVDLMATNAMGYGGNYQTWDYPTTGLLYLGFNARDGLCRAPGVRRALALAVDRDAAAASYANHARPASLPVHPDSPLYSRAAAEDAPGFNPEELSAQAERQRLSGKALVFLVNSENTAKAAVARHIAFQLEGAGLAVDLRQLSFEDFSSALAGGEFDLYLGETVLTADFDLTSLLGSAGALNFGGWQDETADGLLFDLCSASPEDRPAAAQALFSLLNEQTPIVPVLFKNGSVLTQWGQLSDLSPVRGNVFYQIENWIVK